MLCYVSSEVTAQVKSQGCGGAKGLTAVAAVAGGSRIVWADGDILGEFGPSEDLPA